MVAKNSPLSPTPAESPVLTSSPFGTFIDETRREELRLDKFGAEALGALAADFATELDAALRRRSTMLEVLRKSLPDTTDSDAAHVVLDALVAFERDEERFFLDLVQSTEELWRRVAALASRLMSGAPASCAAEVAEAMEAARARVQPAAPNDDGGAHLDASLAQAFFAEIVCLTSATRAVLKNIAEGVDEGGWLPNAAEALVAQIGWLCDLGSERIGRGQCIGDAKRWMLSRPLLEQLRTEK